MIYMVLNLKDLWPFWRLRKRAYMFYNSKIMISTKILGNITALKIT